MKKAAIILLISIYTLSTFGFCLKESYCCGKLKSVSVILQDNENQKCGKAEDRGGCCKTKFQFFKIGEKHFVNNLLIIPDKYFSYLFTLPSYLKIIFPPICKSETTNKNHAPPLFGNVPAYIFNCVFRI